MKKLIPLLVIVLLAACSRQAGTQPGGDLYTPLVASPTLLVLPLASPTGLHPVIGPRPLTVDNAHLLSEVRRLAEQGVQAYTSLAFSPSGHLLATAGSAGEGDALIQLWDPNTGFLVATLSGHAGGIEALAFSPDGKLLASAGADSTVRLWNTTTFEPVNVLQQHDGAVSTVAFSPDGLWLASGSADEQVLLWDLLHLSSITPLPQEGPVASLAFTPDSTALAVTLADGSLEITLWSVPGVEMIQVFPMSGRVGDLAFSPDGRMLAAALQNSQAPGARLLVTGTGQIAFQLDGVHTLGLTAIAFNPDGRLAATASQDGSLSVWDAWNGNHLATLLHDAAVNALAFSPDGLLLASAGSDASVRLWAVPPGEVPPSAQTQTALFAASVTPQATSTAAATPGCGAGFTRLEVGAQAAVVPGDLPLRVRAEPILDDANILTLLNPGESGLVVDGPVCLEDYVFWKLESELIPGGAGWAAEGNGEDYWLEPYTP